MAITKKLFHDFDQGDPVPLGRLLKEVENQTPLSREVLKHTMAKKSRAHVVGITGPPGAGKSTIIEKLCQLWAGRGLKIGVVCVDPTSSFSGGSFLGDRVRMTEAAKLPGVFIKSLATRGRAGGLAASAGEVVQVLDAFGKDVVIVETVGAGQLDLDIADLADTVVLVTVPGLGDTIQTLKAGIMEIGDVYAVNQADRAGADKTVGDLRSLLDGYGETSWVRPVVKTIATRNDGLEELAEGIGRHREFLEHSDQWKQKRADHNEKITRPGFPR